MKTKFGLLAICICYLGLMTAVAQEHPEHPKKEQPAQEKKKEHPEHPKKEAKKEHPEHPTAAKKDYTTADLEQVIKSEIDAKSKAMGGSFKIDDAVTKTAWSMKLDKVHTDRLSKLDENTYFACVDFDSADGKKVDVDFFLKNKDGKLVMDDMTIHKVNGKPRYNWEEKDGLWKRVPLKE
ncbi:MAG TPA: hypothetical protein VIL97_05425 [Thermoanaerobaculia bacterium]